MISAPRAAWRARSSASEASQPWRRRALRRSTRSEEPILTTMRRKEARSGVMPVRNTVHGIGRDFRQGNSGDLTAKTIPLTIRAAASRGGRTDPVSESVPPGEEYHGTQRHSADRWHYTELGTARPRA